MGKITKVILLVFVILLPVIFYNSLNKSGANNSQNWSVLNIRKDNLKNKPRIALVFDDMGESLQKLKEIYALKIKVSLAIIPDLKFSKNIAYIGQRCGYSILIHLPMEPKEKLPAFVKRKRKFIGSHLTKRELERLLNHYLNYVRIAIGVNNHMGSKTTEDEEIMELVLSAVKKKNLIFLDSQTSLNSVACKIAHNLGVRCLESEGFLDSVDNPAYIKKKLYTLVEKAKKKGEAIIIAHPHDNTLRVLKEELPSLKKKVEFVNLKEYLQL